MAEGIKISQMQEKVNIEGTEYIPIVDGSSNKKVKTDKILTKEEAEENYQEKLTSGTNIKTINNQTVLGSGNIEINIPDTSNFATKDEIPDVSDVLTKTEASEVYQVKGNYLTQSSLDNYITVEDLAAGLEDYATTNEVNVELAKKVDVATYNSEKANYVTNSDITDMLTKTEASTLYQEKGNYALSTEIPTKVSDLANDSNYQTASDVDNRVQEIIGSAPEALDTLKEISDALNNDPDFATTITTELSKKVDKIEGKQLSTEDYTTEDKEKLTGIDPSIYAKNEDLVYIADTVIPQMNENTAKALDQKVNWDTEKKVISLPSDGSISALRNAETLEGGVLLAQRTYDEGVSYVTEVGTTKNKLTLNATERPQIDVASGQEKMAYVSDVDEVRDNFDTINFVQKNTTNYELQVGDRIAGSVDISKVGMYYPGVKVDTQKLFALTKDSTEDEIKAALQLETSSGSYTLPTSEILDSCIGKGYQLLSNWMPVSVTWNGAGYVLYIIGQNYMNKPNGLYTVTIKITDGVYSVFQAAKFVEFASKDYVDQVAGDKTNVLILSLEDDLANGEKDQPVTPEISEKLVDAVDTGKACVIKTANSDILANLQKTGDNVTIIMEQVSRISTYFLAVNTAITVNTTSNIISDYSTGAINLADSGTLATKEEVQNKQDKLVSGTNIKTVNGNSLLGEGNVTIEIPDTSDMLTKTDAADTYQVKGEYAKNSDLVYIADTVIPQMNTNTANALDKKVDWDEEKKVISLPADGSISALRNAETLEGGVLLAQRTYDEGITYVTEVGTTKNSLTLNSTSRPKVDLQGGTSEELAYVDDLRTLPVEINIPIRSLKDQIYDQSTILGWFGVEEVSDLKKLIASGGIQYLRYGITLTGTPHYYKMPVEYVAFESNNQIKLVCLGLDTTDDSPTRYTFILNLDGTIASNNSNVSMTLDPIKVDLSNYYTKEEVDSEYQAKQDQLVSGVNIKTVNGASLLGEGNINTPTKTSELTNDSNFVTGVGVNKIQVVTELPEVQEDGVLYLVIKSE